MGKLYKRGKIWYMHDVVNGEEIRESLSTRDWQEARRLRNDRVNEILEGRAGASRRSPASRLVRPWRLGSMNGNPTSAIRPGEPTANVARARATVQSAVQQPLAGLSRFAKLSGMKWT
jgi:hypothetical protein